MNSVEVAYKIMKGGTIGRCNVEIPKGNCTCCLFDTGLGNWIGLIEGEDAILNKGDMSNLEVVTLEGNKSLKCGRLRANLDAGKDHTCDNKPLDCMFYPFFPNNFYLEGNDYVVHCIAGFPKCPLKEQAPINNKIKVEDNTEYNDTEKHLILVSLTTIYLCLNKPELLEQFANSAKGFKGYDKSFVVNISKNLYQHKIQQLIK